MNYTQLQTQAVIVGAGPAGAATSIYLSQAGIRHIVLEKARFPRDKVCGDACSGKTAFVLRKANAGWMQEIFQHEEQYMPSRGIIFVAPNGKQLSIPFGSAVHPGETAPGFTTPRLVFDEFLFNKIPGPCATVYQDAAIESLDQQQDGSMQLRFSCTGQSYQINSPLVVGADGDKSLVRKTFLSDSSLPKAYAVGLRAYYTEVAGLNQENYVELHFIRDILPGYLWIFPLPNGMANVGIGILSEVVRDKKINLRERMLDIIQNHPDIRGRFAQASLVGKIQGWGLPMCVEKLPVSGGHFLLTGDAASLVDPFSGEGIGNALYSGMLAAFAIKACFDENRFDAAFLKAQYDDVLYRRIGNELKISATLQRLCNYPWLFNFVVNKAHKSPSLNKTISCMFTDLDLRAQFSKPSFYLKMLFNR